MPSALTMHSSDDTLRTTSSSTASSSHGPVCNLWWRGVSSSAHNACRRHRSPGKGTRRRPLEAHLRNLTSIMFTMSVWRWRRLMFAFFLTFSAFELSRDCSNFLPKASRIHFICCSESPLQRNLLPFSYSTAKVNPTAFWSSDGRKRLAPEDLRAVRSRSRSASLRWQHETNILCQQTQTHTHER